MEEEKEKLLKLLDEYYGNGRNDSHKEEVADFIISNVFQIVSILKESDYVFE